MPLYLRPVSNAAAQELPLPAKGSSTSSPGSEKLRIRGASAATGFCGRMQLVAAIGHIHHVCQPSGMPSAVAACPSPAGTPAHAGS